MKVTRVFWFTFAALLCGVVAVLAPLVVRQRASHGAALTELRSAVGRQRVTEARLTGGFLHQPLHSPSRSARAPAPNLGLLSAAAALQAQAEVTSNARHLHALGVAELLLGRHQDAVASLEVSSASQPNADVLSDSAAAFLSRATGATSPLWDYAKAIEASSRALELEPAHPEARFNRALALERASLPSAAAQAWQVYLEVDAQGGWADEARAHLRRLSQPATPCTEPRASGACVDRLRIAAEESIAAWATAPAVAQPEALQHAAETAMQFEKATGDRLLARAVAAIESADPSCRALLARAHRQYVDARVLYETDRRQEAFVKFGPIARDLRACHSPFALWAEISRAVIDVHARRLSDAAAKLDLVDATSKSQRYGAVSARSTWLRGIVRLHQAGPGAALIEYRSALDQYAAIGDDVGAGSVANAAADSCRIIGELPEGWQMLDRAIATLAVSNEPVRRYVSYYNAALFSLDSGLARAALAFQREAVVEGRRRSAQAMLLEGLLNQAVVLDAVGKATAALDALAEAETYRAAITDAQQASYMAARLAAVRGQIRSRTGAPGARADLTSAIETFSRLEGAELPRLYQFRARAALAGGSQLEAAQDLDESLRLFEARQGALHDDRQRISYADVGWTIYQDLIRLRIANHEWEDALQFAEVARARTLRARHAFERRGTDQLHPDTVILFYVVLDDDSYVWTVTARGAQPHRLGVSRTELENRVRLLRWQVEHGADEAPALATSLQSLYELLIAPALANVAARQIVVIPDAFLARIPFQALRSPSGRYLVEDVEVVIAPSIDLFLQHIKRPRSASPLQVLAIGDPAFDAATSTLPRLPRARGEAERAAHAYAHSVLLTDREATAARLRQELPTADVFHFAGHAIANVEFPELSRLMVAAPENGDDGGFLARDIGGAGIRPGALVILSACRTGEGRIGGAEGPQSLGRAFLAAGAGAVIVSLWDVEDEATQGLFDGFHRAYAAGEDATAALRDAQLAMIAQRRPVSQWAAFHVVVGGKQPVSTLKGAE